MKQSWKVFFAFGGVFIAGMICGGPVAGWLRNRQEQNRPPFAERTMKRFEHELQLTAPQKEKIYPILLNAQKEWRQLRQDNVNNMTVLLDRMHEQLVAELNPEQRGRMEELRKEFRARAERFRGRVRDGEHR